jgi:hypothetical protein
MAVGKFKKQPFEEFVIAANFANNMNIPTEDLVLGSCTVTAVDVNEVDATATVTDQSTISIGTAEEQGYLKILIRAGVEADSPYKITFRGVTDSTPPEKWEKDVQMTIEEQ